MKELDVNSLEIWKDIPNYEGIYQVSNFGNVRALVFRNHKCIKPKIHILKKQIDKYGRERIMLHKNSKQKLYQVHRLVAQAFISNPNNFPEVNHKDENPLNNNVDNLEFCTRSYNAHYGTGIVRMGIEHRKPIVQLDKDFKIIKTWSCGKEIANYYGVTPAAISNCCKGKSKTCCGYIWRFINE